VDPPNIHHATAQQNFPYCHRFLAFAAHQDEAEGDDDGLCVQAELNLYLFPPLDSKIHYHRPNGFGETYSLLLNHQTIYTSAFG